MIRLVRRWTRIFVALWLANLLSPGPATAVEYNPFKVPQAEFFITIGKLAMWPASLPTGFPESEEVRSEIEKMLIDALRKKRYEVIPSEVVRRRWEELSAQVGGVFDPVTGESNQEQIDLLRGILTQEFALQQGVDAFVFSYVSEGTIPVWSKRLQAVTRTGTYGYNVWMGAHEAITWRGEKVRSLWRNRPTETFGVRLGIRLLDPTDVVLYDMMFPVRWSRVYIDAAYDDRPESRLLDDRSRLETVVGLLVEDLDEPESRKP